MCPPFSKCKLGSLFLLQEGEALHILLPCLAAPWSEVVGWFWLCHLVFFHIIRLVITNAVFGWLVLTSIFQHNTFCCVVLSENEKLVQFKICSSVNSNSAMG